MNDLPLNRFTWIALRTNMDWIRKMAWSRVRLKATPFEPSSSAVRILVGGDMSFDPEIRIYSHLGAYALRNPWDPVVEMTPNKTIISTPSEKSEGIIRRARGKLQNTLLTIYKRHFLLPEFRTPDRNSWEVFREIVHKDSGDQEPIFIPEIYGKMFKFPVPDPPGGLTPDFPFLKLAAFMKEKDFVLMNLETPLTRHPRAYGLIISDPEYAKAIKNAGISMVCLANNHIFDAGEIGFMDTMKHLDREEIPYIGAGNNLNEARSGRVEIIRGIRVGFLSYTQHCNMNFASIAADYPGILPMDLRMMVEDIKVIKQKADFVFVSLHWGTQFEPIPHPKQTEIAHLLIDQGADAIIGHHGHIAQGIEIYKGKPILYCLGNFIFGIGDIRWVSDNYLTEIVVDPEGIQGVVIHPVSGLREELLQPEVLKGPRAEALLRTLQIKSAYFHSGIHIQEDKGYINIRDTLS